jgi:uncharacterized membrane protein YphA (DoxX/SURF4 family)
MQATRSRVEFEDSARPLLLGLLAVQVFLGYEWFMSGVAKVIDGGFASGLAATLSDQTKDLSGPYKSFVDSVVIPNGELFGYLVMAGELALGIVLIAAALLWTTRWSQLGFTGRQIVLGLIVLSGVVAIFMNINFHLAGGANHPWLIAADPNGEGVDLDSLMPIIQTIISVVAFVFLRRLRSERPVVVTQPAVSAGRA